MSSNFKPGPDYSEVELLLTDTFGETKLSRAEKKRLQHLVSQMRGDRRRLNHFSRAAFNMAKLSVSTNRDRSILNWLEGIAKVIYGQTKLMHRPTARVVFSPGEACRDQILTLLGGVKRGVDICVFSITDNLLRDEILAAHRRSVRVRIVTDNDKSFDRGSDIDTFAQAGIAVKMDESRHHMHHKFAVFDQQSALTGSFNWTVSASAKNYENMVVLSDPQPVAAFSDEFARLWDELPYHPMVAQRVRQADGLSP